MEKLTIKEIAGYLPYGLKLLHIDTDEFEQAEITTELESACSECLTFKDGADFYFENSDVTIKPILYPLSMLTQEIEHNGDKFVPIVRLLGHEFLIKHNHSFGYDRKKYYSKFMIENTNEWIYGNIPSDLQSMDYFTVSKLQEWHFDIHALIEKGLAIDKSKI